MKQTQINSGKFTAAEGSKGNFTGYNAKGERIFVNKLQMAGIGCSKDADVKFPFYALIDIKQINTRDEDGVITDVKVDRLQALSVFKTAAELTQAVNADVMLEISAAAELKTAATAAGLNDTAVNSLLALA